MKDIIWQDYLQRDDLKTCSPEKIKETEDKIGYKLPAPFKNIMMHHGEQKPTNLVPVYPKGGEMLI